MKRRSLIYLLLAVLLLLSLSGCKRNPIVEKLATGQALTAEEKAEYIKDADTKKRFDDAAQERKEDIAKNSYYPPTEEQKKLGAREYHGRELKISPVICDQVGFLEGSRVKTPDGDGYFVGVDKDGDGWFHLDGGSSLHYYKGGKDEYIKKGFKLLASPNQAKAARAEEVAKEEAQPTLEEKPKENPAPPSVKAKAGAAATKAPYEATELQAGEIEKLAPIPPVPPLKEK